MQNGGVVKYNYKRLMRGATPNLTIALCQLVFGLTMGAAINNKIKNSVT